MRSAPTLAQVPSASKARTDSRSSATARKDGSGRVPANGERASSTTDAGSEAWTYAVSIRGSAGIGAGGEGIAGRFGLAGDYWLNDWLGVGLGGALLTQSVILQSSTQAQTLTFAGEVRSAPRGSYFFVSLGGGVANARTRNTCLDLFGTGCSAPPATTYLGYTVAAAVGWLAHPGAGLFEIGPVGELDVVGDYRGSMPQGHLFTVNLVLGGAVRRKPE